MKSIIILNDESFYLTDFLDQFLQNTKHPIEHVFTVDFFPPQADKSAYTKASIAIMSHIFLLRYLGKTLKQNLLKILPLPIKLKRRASIAHACKHHNVAHKKIVDVNDPEFLAWLSEHRIETVMSICSQIYKKPILNLPNLKLYNFHPSLLPKNKGRFPIFWAFLRGDEQGMTCHRIVEKIDAGEILCQKSIPTSNRDDVASVLDKVTQLSPSFFEEAFDRIKANNPQMDLHPGESFYGPTPTLEQIQEYRRIIRDRRSKA